MLREERCVHPEVTFLEYKRTWGDGEVETEMIGVRLLETHHNTRGK